MKHSWSLLLLLLASGCPPPPAPDGPPPRAAGGKVVISILSTNDFHGQLDPLPLVFGAQQQGRVLVGGAQALAATVARARAENPHGTVLVDAGDFMQGSLISNHFEGAPVRELFELLRYDAVIIGNHEFDFGPVGPGPPDSPGDRVGALKAWTAKATFPVLTANVTDARGRPVRWPNVKPSVVLERKGVRVGLIGVTTVGTATAAMPAVVQDLRFTPLLSAVQREARRLRAAGVQLVLVVAHAGGLCKSRAAASCQGELFADLVDRLKPGLVDAVIGGHTHRCIWHRRNGVLVTEACSRGRAVGRLRLVLDRASGKLDPEASQALPPLPVCHQVFAGTGRCDPIAAAAGGALVPNPLLGRHRELADRAAALVARYRARVYSMEQRRLAVAARAMSHDRFRSSEVATLVAQALLRAVPGADFAIMNSGGVRANLPAGVLTYRHLFDAMPFDNRVASARLTGAQLRRLIEVGIARSFGIFQLAGLRLTVRCGAPIQVVDLRTAQGAALQPDRHYTVAMTDFLLSGGDGVGPVLQAVPPRDRKVHPLLVRQAIARHMQAADGPLNSEARPVVSPDNPPVVVQGGPCMRRRGAGKYVCR